MQDSELHLKVSTVAQLIQKFIDDNRDRPEDHAALNFNSRRLQSRALLVKTAALEKAVISGLGFDLNVPTPAEFIVVYIHVFETKVTQIDWETIMMLRGQSLSNSYICLHIGQCAILGAQAVALACILNVMVDWQWHDVADSFLELMQTEAEDACSLDEVLHCQQLLHEIILREQEQEQNQTLPPSDYSLPEETKESSAAEESDQHLQLHRPEDGNLNYGDYGEAPQTDIYGPEEESKADYEDGEGTRTGVTLI